MNKPFVVKHSLTLGNNKTNSKPFKYQATTNAQKSKGKLFDSRGNALKAQPSLSWTDVLPLEFAFLFNKLSFHHDDIQDPNLSREQHSLKSDVYCRIVSQSDKSQMKILYEISWVIPVNVRSEHVLNPIAAGSQFESQMLLHGGWQINLWINFTLFRCRCDEKIAARFCGNFN